MPTNLYSSAFDEPRSTDERRSRFINAFCSLCVCVSVGVNFAWRKKWSRTALKQKRNVTQAEVKFKYYATTVCIESAITRSAFLFVVVSLRLLLFCVEIIFMLPCHPPVHPLPALPCGPSGRFFFHFFAFAASDCLWLARIFSRAIVVC